MSDLIPIHLSHLRAAGYARRSVDDRSRFLHWAHQHLPYGLDMADGNEWAELLSEPSWSMWTRSTYWSHGFGYYEWGVTTGELLLNPMAALKRPPAGDDVPDPVTDEELRIALDRSPDRPWRTAIMLAAYAGLRASEIARLRRQDITEENVTIRKGKGGRDALVETSPVLWDYIRYRPPGPLVLTCAGRPLTGRSLTANQAKHWRRIGLPEIHLHRFRHWFATNLLRGGVDIRTVQELMRHRSLISTQAYTLVVSAQRTAAVASLSLPAAAAAHMGTRAG